MKGARKWTLMKAGSIRGDRVNVGQQEVGKGGGCVVL
jgi:hypothetical protein